MEFLYDGKTYPIEIKRKNNKNLYIRVRENKVIITCPLFYTKSMIEKVIKENNDSIENMIVHQMKRTYKEQSEKHNFLGKTLNIVYKDVKRPQVNGDTIIIKDEEMLLRWYKKKALETFQIYLDEAYYVFEEKIPYPKLKVRSMKTRWGVCNRKDNSVTLNLQLIYKSHEYLNYVIVHELSHFVHFDHSKEFWNTVEKYCPEYKKVRKELK